ncbi:MAG: hypothetical protein K2P13_12535 [Lachnospiraceae bacterium]|nr:hypothetical protein [Lachnospiraceae bacterium]MDE6977795.1 hypothetical protein [Lachnospiraceae bacterium]
MSKKGFNISLQNMAAPNFTGLLMKQSFGGFAGANLLTALQGSYWMKHKKSGGPEKTGEECAAEDEEVAAETADEETVAAASSDADQDSRGQQMDAPAMAAGQGGRDTEIFSTRELKRAMAMSVVLGPPACRRRKKNEGITGRR